jgi:hypothetical protein
MLRPLLLLALVLPIAACDGSREEGTTITFNSEDGNAAGAVDGKTGAVKIDLPGFKGELTLPKIKLDAENFDLNGVHLYPGSTIDAIDVRGDHAQSGGVHVRFSSPATPATVRDWFRGRLEKAGFTLRSEGNALVGQDEDNKPFRMELAPQGTDRAAGTIVIGT